MSAFDFSACYGGSLISKSPAPSYPLVLKLLYSVNDSLKKDGILAPSDDSLAHTRRLYELIGRPLDRIPTIHVGGTNGKGSTSFKLAQCLIASGLKTGLFVSPHLSSSRERMQVNGNIIPADSFVEHATTALRLCIENEIPATLFELFFIMSCLYFEKEACDAVVMEVGLGGQLDATNVISTALSIICSVSLDHTRILGSTVEEIMQKKAGIFKSGRDAIIGPGCPMQVAQNVATERMSNLHSLGDVMKEALDKLTASAPSAILSSSSSSSSVSSPLLRIKRLADNVSAMYSPNPPSLSSTTPVTSSTTLIDTDDINSCLTFAALYLLKERNIFGKLDLLDPLFVDALHRRPPCRWELHKYSISTQASGENGCEDELRNVDVVLDVGHNPAAIEALVRRIKRDFDGRVLRILYGVSRDKDYRKCLRSILSLTSHDRIHFAQSSNFRALSTSELGAIFLEETGHEMTPLSSSNIKDRIVEILKLAANESANSVVVICGTGYLMPDAREAIGISEPRDDYDLASI